MDERVRGSPCQRMIRWRFNSKNIVTTMFDRSSRNILYYA